MAEPMAYALITGASSGIGRHLALELAARGLDVVLVARNDSPLQELRLEIETRHQVRATVIAIDLSVPGAAANLYTELRTSMPPPDVLVNNAGFGSFGLFHEADGEVLQRLVQVNILALTCLLRRALPEMRARGSGRVLNVASCAAFNAGPLMAVYFATKAYVLHLSEAVAQECVGSGGDGDSAVSWRHRHRVSSHRGLPRGLVVIRTASCGTAGGSGALWHPGAVCGSPHRHPRRGQ